MANKVAFVTGSRADYGIMRRFLSLVNQDSEIELDILVTGALLSNTYGHQVDLIYKDGFNVKAEIEVPLDSSSNVKILHTMAVTLDKFAELLVETNKSFNLFFYHRYSHGVFSTKSSFKQIFSLDDSLRVLDILPSERSRDGRYMNGQKFSHTSHSHRF